MNYKAKEEAITLPRAFYLDGSWVGIGGEITREGIPPNIGTILKEASAKQYEALYKMGLTHLIEEVEESTKEVTEPKPSKK